MNNLLLLYQTIRICQGDSVQLEAFGGIAYSWSPNINISNTNISNPLVYPSSNKVYTVTVTNENGCNNSANVRIIVNKPIISVNSPSICKGNSATLIANGANEYIWSNNLSNQSSVITPALFSNTSFTVTGTTGCSNTAIATVNIDSIPPSILFLGNDTTYCGNFTRVLSTGIFVHLYGVRVILRLLFTVNFPRQYTAMVKNGCGSSNDTINIYRTQLPNIIVNSPTICKGQSVILTASGASTYIWSTSQTEVKLVFLHLKRLHTLSQQQIIAVKPLTHRYLFQPLIHQVFINVMILFFHQ